MCFIWFRPPFVDKLTSPVIQDCSRSQHNTDQNENRSLASVTRPTMGQHDPFETWGDDLWSKLDDLDDSDWWQDSPDERQKFVKRVRDDMRAPANEARDTSNDLLNLPLQVGDKSPRDGVSQTALNDRSRSLPVSVAPQPDLTPETPGRPPNHVPSFDTPHVDTPPIPKSLPRPRVLPAVSTSTPTVSTRPPTILDTPVNVPTPTQTQGDLSVGRGRRDNPATPVPLGDEASLKKVSYTKISNQFNAFNLKILAAVNRAGEESSGRATRGKSRGRAIGLRSTRSTPRPEVLKGMRFCMPPEGPHCGPKHEARWSKVIVVSHTVADARSWSMVALSSSSLTQR